MSANPRQVIAVIDRMEKDLASLTRMVAAPRPPSPQRRFRLVKRAQSLSKRIASGCAHERFDSEAAEEARELAALITALQA